MKTLEEILASEKAEVVAKAEKCAVKKLAAMDAIVSNLDNMSDAELQEKFDNFKPGAVSYAMNSNPHIGGTFDDFLSEQGILEECEDKAIKQMHID